jgi:lysozyme
MIDLYTVSQRLLLHEGLRLQPYRCSKGKLTIGIGRCLDTNPLTDEEKAVVGQWERGITKCAALYLLRNDIKRVYAELKKRLDFFKDLDAERQYALIDMAFNLGVHGLLQFRKMLEALKLKDYRRAAIECLASKYARETGQRAKRIAYTLEKGVFKL